jgi:excisionase family DNA binding protein
MPRLLTIPLAAEYLSTTERAIRRLIWSRRLPYVPLGKRKLVDRVDLDKIVETSKVSE